MNSSKFTEVWNRQLSPQWVRSATDSRVAGVCGGIAQKFEIDSWVVRLVWFLSIFFGFGIGLYILLAICIPKQGRIEASLRPKIFGVCRKIGIKYDLEIGIVRLFAVFLALSSFGFAVLGYFVMAIALSNEVKPQPSSSIDSNLNQNASL